MCKKADCEKCNKPTWKGCGKHIEEALKDVPEDERCKCPRDPPASTTTETNKVEEQKVEATTTTTEVKPEEPTVETTATAEIKAEKTKVETTATTEEAKEKID